MYTYMHIHFHLHTCYHESSRTSLRLGWKRDTSDRRRTDRCNIHTTSHRTWRVQHLSTSGHVHESDLPWWFHSATKHTVLHRTTHGSRESALPSHVNIAGLILYIYFSKSLRNLKLCFVINSFGRRDKVTNSVFISGNFWLFDSVGDNDTSFVRNFIIL